VRLFDGDKLYTYIGTDAKRRTTVENKCMEESTSPPTDADDDNAVFTPTLMLQQTGLVLLGVAVFVGFIVVVCKAAAVRLCMATGRFTRGYVVIG